MTETNTMRQKTNFEEESELMSVRLGHWWLWGAATDELSATMQASFRFTSDAQLQPSLNHARNSQTAFSALLFQLSPNPGTWPGFSFDTQQPATERLPAPHTPRRPEVKLEGTDSFHNSESEDIYDLYNACNGIVRNGLLDINELGKLSQQESAALNVPKLKEIWRHTATGCARCAHIIEILNLARQTLAQELKSLPEQNDAVDLNVIDAIDSIS
jgi:hypothetical protein